MSFNLRWYKPPQEERAVGSGGTTLKFLLAERYGERDGSCREEFSLEECDIPFLKLYMRIE